MAKKSRIKKKICLVCGEDFFGTAGKITCDPACRMELVRLKKAGKRPEFLLMAKTAGQKIPDLTAPKRLVFKKGEKKPKTEILVTNIVYTPTTEKSFDSPKTASFFIQDEAGQFEVPKPLTAEQKLSKRIELEGRQKELERQQHKPGDGHPRTWRLAQDAKINEIKEQIKNLE